MESVDEFSAGIWFHIGGQPQWVQSDEHPGSEYIFVGQMQSCYTNTTIYAFYDHSQQEVIFQCQFT